MNYNHLHSKSKSASETNTYITFKKNAILEESNEQYLKGIFFKKINSRGHSRLRKLQDRVKLMLTAKLCCRTLHKATLCDSEVLAAIAAVQPFLASFCGSSLRQWLHAEQVVMLVAYP